MKNRGEFTRAVFEKIDAPIDGPRLAFGVAWAAFENTEAMNNPWATTEPWVDAIEYNNAGVKNYRTFENGVDATVATLLNGDYNFLLRVLRNRHSTIRQCLNALDCSPWGSHPNTLLWQEVVMEYAKFNKNVPGSDTGVVAPAVETPTIFVGTVGVSTPPKSYTSGNPNDTFIGVGSTISTFITPTPTTESDKPVDNETPAVDTLESRLAELPKPKSIQELLDEQNATENTEVTEEPTDFLG